MNYSKEYDRGNERELHQRGSFSLDASPESRHVVCHGSIHDHNVTRCEVVDAHWADCILKSSPVVCT
jgi:hypothetical protein